MWIIFIPITVIILFLVFNYIILPKMNNKYEEKIQNLTDEFANQIRGKEDAYRHQFISSNKTISTMASAINSNDIIGVISCQQKMETKDVIRQEVINVARKTVGKMLNANIDSLEDNGQYYYLVLTPNTLNYLHYTLEGELVESLSFDRAEMQNIESGEITSADILKNKAAVGHAVRLSFGYGDSTFKFFYYDILAIFPTDHNNSDEDVAKLNYLFAKPFIEFGESCKKHKA